MASVPTPSLQALTVSELTFRIRQALERDFLDLWVEGEISNLRAPGSGHVYCSLKDQASQIRTVMFRGVASRIPFALQDGLQVVVRGHLSVYEPRGEYQLVVEYLEPKGIGALQLAFEQLKRKLEQEGLFDPAKKRPLPFLPRRVGLITSRSGAALHDLVTVLQRRCPIIQIVIYPVRVQGEGAAHDIAQAVRTVGAIKDVDLIIVARGGGSLEDLWCFNEEIVVRAVAECPIPVVSAVGHEIDFTLTDFAADVRAPTPSVAAEIVSPLLEDLVGRLHELQQRLQIRMINRFVRWKELVSVYTPLMPDPLGWINQKAQRVDEITHRLFRAIQRLPAIHRPRIWGIMAAMTAHSPRQRVAHAARNVAQLRQRIRLAVGVILVVKRKQLQVVVAALEALSPLAILSRGYSIVETWPARHRIRTFEDVSPGDQVRARLAQGSLVCRVEQTTVE